MSASDSDSEVEIDNQATCDYQDWTMKCFTKYPDTIPTVDSSGLSDRYASAAKLVKETLVEHLNSEDCNDVSDVQAIINSANFAFASLTSLGSDFRSFYDKVTRVIRCKGELVDTMTKLELPEPVICSHLKDLIQFQSHPPEENSREELSRVFSDSSCKLQSENLRNDDALFKAIVKMASLDVELAIAKAQIVALRAESDQLEKAELAQKNYYNTTLAKLDLNSYLSECD